MNDQQIMDEAFQRFGEDPYLMGFTIEILGAVSAAAWKHGKLTPKDISIITDQVVEYICGVIVGKIMADALAAKSRPYREDLARELLKKVGPHMIEVMKLQVSTTDIARFSM